MSTNNKLAKQLHRHILMRTEIRRGDRVCLQLQQLQGSPQRMRF